MPLTVVELSETVKAERKRLRDEMERKHEEYCGARNKVREFEQAILEQHGLAEKRDVHLEDNYVLIRD